MESVCVLKLKIILFLFLQKSMDLKEACVFHLCITFTSASVNSGIHLSPVSDRVDKTPNGWLTEWVSSVPIRRKTLSAFAVSILAGMYISGCQSFSFWVQNICVTFHVTSISQCVKTVSSCVIFMCLCTVYAHYFAHVPALTWCIAVYVQMDIDMM